MAKAISQEYVEDSASEDEKQSSNTKSFHGSQHNSREAGTSSLKPSRTEKADSSSSSDSESDGDSSESSLSNTSAIDSSQNGVKRKQSTVNHENPKKRARSGVMHIPSQPYHPPSGYLPTKPAEIDSELASAFLRQDSTTKQVWHITAPASLPITKIKSFDMQMALQGASVLEHRGVKYNMRSTATKDEQLLLPNQHPVSTGTGNQTTVAYGVASINISRTLYLQEMNAIAPPGQTQNPATSTKDEDPLSDLASDETVFTAQTTGQRPAPRKQPKGLLKRFQPYGSGSGHLEKMVHPDSQGLPIDEELGGGDRTSNGDVARSFIAPPDLPDFDDTSSAPKVKREKRKKDRTQREPINGVGRDEQGPVGDVEMGNHDSRNSSVHVKSKPDKEKRKDRKKERKQK